MTSVSRFFFSSRRRHTRSLCDWSSDVCSSDLRKQPWRSLCTRPCRVEKTPRARLRAKPNLRITVRPQEQIAQFSEPSGNSVPDRKSTRLNSSHTVISYAVFCLKKKKKKYIHDV